MAKLLIDVNAGTREPVAPGYKMTRVAKVEFAQSGEQSKVPGTPMLKIQLKVVEGPDEGRTLFTNIMLAGGGAWRAVRDLPAVRPDLDWKDYDFPETPADTDLIEQVVEDLIDEDVIALVAHKPDDRNPGEFRSEVVRLLPKDADVTLDEEAA